MRSPLLVLVLLLGCAGPTGPGDRVARAADERAWVVSLEGGAYFCRVPVDGGAGPVRYPSPWSAIEACRAIREGWVPPW